MSNLTKKLDQKEESRGLDFHPLQNRDLEQTLIYIKLLSYVVMADGKLQKEEKERFSLVVKNLGLDPEECLNELESLQADELEEICKGLKDEFFQAMLLIDAGFISKIGKDEKKVLDKIISYCDLPADSTQKLSKFNEVFKILKDKIESFEGSLDSTEGISWAAAETEKSITITAGADDSESYQDIINKLIELSDDSLKDPVIRDITLYFFVIMKYKFGEMLCSLKKNKPEQKVKVFIESSEKKVRDFLEQNVDEHLASQKNDIVKKILNFMNEKKEGEITKTKIDSSVFNQFTKVLFDKFPKGKRGASPAEKNAYRALVRELKSVKIDVDAVKFEKERTGCLAGIITFFVTGLILSPWMDSQEWVSAIPIIAAIVVWRRKNNSKTFSETNSAIFDEKVVPAIRSSLEKSIPAAIEKSSGAIAETYAQQIERIDETLKAFNKAIIKLQRAKEKESQ